MSKLNGKNILITGASQGLGREMALRFAREGAAGLSLVARHINQLNKVRDDVRKLSPKSDIVVIEADVSKPRDVERIVATTLAQFKGQIDVLVMRVNWVDPGNMNTAMHRAAEPEEDPAEWTNPADVTDVFVFLASDASKNVNGKRFQAQEDWKSQIHHEEHEAEKN